MSKEVLRWLLPIVMLCGVSVYAMGLSSLLGHIFGIINLYKWHSDVGMAINTSVCFVLTGFSLFSLAVHLNDVSKSK